MVRTVCEDVGLALIALGVALVYLPAGIIAAGLLIVLAANLHADVRQRLTPAEPEPDARPAADLDDRYLL